jgi:CheY-like chemotaxis protein
VHARAIRDAWLEFTVTDTGPGFSPAALKRALEPFFTTKGGQGSGLGLAMVDDQTRLAGGSLHLANRPEGGAIIALRLPYRPVTIRAQPALVLLVEDDAVIRTEVRHMLRAMGHAVVEAASAAEALELAGLPGLGLILSDIGLPGDVDGVGLMGILARQGHGARRMLMTSAPGAAQRAAETGLPVLSKPFTFAALSAFLAAAEE